VAFYLLTRFNKKFTYYLEKKLSLFKFEIYSMKLLSFSIVFLSICSLSFAQNYSISGEVDGLLDGDVLLGYYYGDKQYVKDTVQSVNGAFVFESDDALESGMYFMLLSDKQFFQFIIDQDRTFNFSTSNTNLVGDMEIDGSIENELFYEYQQFTQQKGIEVQPIKEELQLVEKDAKKAEKLQAKLTAINQQVATYKTAYINEYSNSLFVKMLQALEPINIPEAPILENGSIDSSFQYKYFKSHFWDHIDLTDDRMIRTPIFHDKMKKYIVDYTPQVADSITKYVDILIEEARPSTEIFKYVVNWTTHHYESSKIMGHDAVFVHMVFSYFVTRQASWVDEVQLTNIIDKAMRISPNLIGSIAPYITLPDDKGVIQDLHSIEAPFTILFFYDPDCGHCKKETPLVKETLEKYMDRGVQVYAVCTEFDDAMWKEFIVEFGVEYWINVNDLENISNFRGKYNVMGTPRLFILDAKKEIIAKQIDADALDEILENEFRLLGEKN
jgi:peroxiredoxin